MSNRKGKTELFAQWLGGSLVINNEHVRTGKSYYVHSGTGASTNSGLTPDAPLATIDQGINKCTASKGDTVFVMPGHAENVTAADGIDCDVKGVSVIGLGSGSLIPTVSFTAAAGSITVAAADVTLQNLKLVANFATGTTTGMTIAAAGDGCTIKNCKFRDTSATSEFLKHISVATTVTDLLISGCSFVTAAGSMTGSVVFAGSSTDCIIEDSTWYVDSSDSVIDHQTTAAVNILLRRNAVINVDTDAAGYCVELKTGSTGIAHDNRFGYNKVDAEVAVGDAVWWFENYASNTIAQSGLLDPTTAHAIP